MNAVYSFDIKTYTRGLLPYTAAILLFSFGMFTGTKANLSTGEGIYLNSPYTAGFMLGLLSLSIIFIATVTGSQLLFKEWDARFDQLLFATPVTKKQFTAGRFLSFYFITLTGFFLLLVGFIIGQSIRSGANMQAGFQLSYYLYPLFIFGCVNSLFVCSALSLMAWATKNKLMVAVGGLLLYVLYMIVLLFSGSPFMAQSTPQSLDAQYISALADPFGLSSYFFESRSFSVEQRNSFLTPLTGTLLLNRLFITALSLLLLYFGKKLFPVSFARAKQKNKNTNEAASTIPDAVVHAPYQTVTTTFTISGQIKAVLSFLKTDLIYIFKSIPVAVAVIVLLFSLGMEVYAEIEKGIRLPQKFASSGLMATTILENFHLLGVLLVVYYTNDLYWRSSTSRFAMLEQVTQYSFAKMLGHWFSSATLILFFSLAAIVLGLVFQVAYKYTQFDVKAYWGVIVFNSCPLILLAGFLLMVNRLIRHKYGALGCSLVIGLLLASPLTGKLINYPLLRFFTGFMGNYSDFNGYGPYLISFVQRLLIGFCMIVIVWQLLHLSNTQKLKSLSVIVLMSAVGFFSATLFMDGYVPEKKQADLIASSNYEKLFRKYQSLPHPTITDVKTDIHLYPRQNAYQIEGVYTLINKTDGPIKEILLNFDSDLKIEKAQYISEQDSFNLSEHISSISLPNLLAPNDTALLRFIMSYSWKPVNGHKSFNAIIENGSFMRISRYYPQIGYQPGNELQDEEERKQFNLGEATALNKLEDPRDSTADFVNLDMTIDTDEGQTAVGTGELVKDWSSNGRHYFQYKTPQPVPFRFAVSSAVYKQKSMMYDGIKIQVLYHPGHKENVEHLLTNAKLTLDYCINNFGPYPYQSITFAEVSSFTRGFAATAYPATIFMTEDMIFHANIKADKKQDVINELAGHELSHLWWGGNQIAPDEREGAAMLTETLAMYTEMMLYKKMYGKDGMMERVKVHQQIYDAEKGFYPKLSLYKVLPDYTHISYSKGAVVMVQLSELIGEAKVNEALKHLLIAYKYPKPKPTAVDFVNEVLEVSDTVYHKQIKKLFMEE